MKVVFITNLYGHNKRGGAEKLVEREAKYLQSKGHDVVVISTGRRQEVGTLSVAQSQGDGVRVYRFCPPNIFFYTDAAKHSSPARMLWTVIDLFNFWPAVAVKKIIKKENPDLIMVHNLKGISGLAPMWLGKFRDKCVFTLHDVQLVNPSGLVILGQEKHWVNDSWLQKIYMMLCRKLFSGVQKVVSPSRFLLDYYSARSFFAEADKKIIGNPAIYENIRPTMAAPGKAGLSLLFVGQLEEHKGLPWLIKAMQKMDFALGQTGLTLSIVGSGSQAGKYQSDKIIWLGWLGQEGLLDAISKADFLVFPSRCQENSPSVIYEALCAGLPVIASRVGGVPELVQDGYNGILFEAGNEQEFTVALGRAITSNWLKDNAASSVAKYNMANYWQEVSKFTGLRI